VHKDIYIPICVYMCVCAYVDVEIDDRQFTIDSQLISRYRCIYRGITFSGSLRQTSDFKCENVSTHRTVNS